MNKKYLVLLIALASAVFPAAASGSQEAQEGPSDERLGVFVSILPQKFFVERIGGDRVSVEVMVQPGRSPATYEPTPNQAAALGAADVFFTIGVSFENAFIPRIAGTLKSLDIVDTSSGIDKRHIAFHVHEDGEEHGHAGDEGPLDPHVWLSPILVKHQAGIIMEKLSELDPDGAGVYRKGYEDFVAELDAVDAGIRESLAPYSGSVLFVFHPAFGYFADEYGLRQVAVEIGGREPSASELEEVIELAKDEGTRIIFAQPEFSRRTVDALADAVGASVVILNPLNPDYLNGIRELAAEVRKAYE